MRGAVAWSFGWSVCVDAMLEAQFAEGAQVEKAIRENHLGLGHG